MLLDAIFKAIARLLATLVGVLLVTAISYLGGCMDGTSRTKAKYESDYQAKVKKLEEEKRRFTRERDLAERDRALIAQQHYQAEVSRTMALAEQLRTEKAAHAQTARKLKARSQHVTTNYQRAPDAAPEPIPHCVFTRGFVREFNAATGAHDFAAATATPGAAREADPATSADALESGLTPADILNYMSDYGARCQGLESQVNRLIDAYEGLGHAR